MFMYQILCFLLGFLFGGLLTIIFIWIIFFRKKNILEKSNQDFTLLSNQIKTITEDYVTFKNKEIKNEFLLNEVLTSVNTLGNTLTKGASVTQGNWSQTICENILKEIGFKREREYESQKKYLDINGKEKIPDFVVHLPENRDIIIDSKVSITNWNKYVNATNDVDKTQAKKQHVISVMKHIKDLSEAGYTNLRDLNSNKELNTGEFILMFMPIENAYQALAEESDKIRSEAIRNNITIVGPSTLQLALIIVEQMWSMDKQAKNTKDAITIANKMYNKAVNITKSFQSVTKSFTKAQDSIEIASKQIESGDGNFINLVNKFKNQLGIVAKEDLLEKKHIVEKKDNEEIEN